jgi:hypothetical protein
MPISLTYVSLLHVRLCFNPHFTSKIRGWDACDLECVLQTDKLISSCIGHASLSISIPNIPLQSPNHYFQRNVGSDNMRFGLLQLRYEWGLKVGVCCQNFKYWLPCFIVSCWFFINAFFPMENKSSSSPYAVLLLCSIWRGRASFHRTYFYLFFNF